MLVSRQRRAVCSTVLKQRYHNIVYYGGSFRVVLEESNQTMRHRWKQVSLGITRMMASHPASIHMAAVRRRRQRGIDANILCIIYLSCSEVVTDKLRVSTSANVPQ